MICKKVASKGWCKESFFVDFTLWTKKKVDLGIENKYTDQSAWIGWLICACLFAYEKQISHDGVSVLLIDQAESIILSE